MKTMKEVAEALYGEPKNDPEIEAVSLARFERYFSDKGFVVESPSAMDAANWVHRAWAVQDAPDFPIYIAWDLAKEFENPLKKLRPKIRREGWGTLD